MPKIFKDAKEHIMDVSRKIMEEKGFNALTMRDVATKSGYGIGTIYNYFPNKLSILASLLLEEWQEDEKALKLKIEQSSSFREAIKAIYDEIEAFFETHRDLFFSISIPSSIRGKLQNGHEIFLRTIEGYVASCQTRFDLSSNENSRRAACILLIQAPSIYGAPFEDVYDSLEELLTGGNQK